MPKAIYPCSLDPSDKERMKRRPIRCVPGNCFGCGFDPKERDRRLKTGVFKTRIMKHSLHDDNGKVIETIEREVRTLVFKRAGA